MKGLLRRFLDHLDALHRTHRDIARLSRHTPSGASQIPNIFTLGNALYVNGGQKRGCCSAVDHQTPLAQSACTSWRHKSLMTRAGWSCVFMSSCQHVPYTLVSAPSTGGPRRAPQLHYARHTTTALCTSCPPKKNPLRAYPSISGSSFLPPERVNARVQHAHYWDTAAPNPPRITEDDEVLPLPSAAFGPALPRGRSNGSASCHHRMHSQTTLLA